MSDHDDYLCVSQYDDPYVDRYDDRAGDCELYRWSLDVITTGVAPSAVPDGDVTTGVASMAECAEHDAVLSDCVCDYDDHFYDGQYDNPDYYDYDDPDDYGGNFSIHEFDDPDDYVLYHDLHVSDSCGEYCVSHGAVNADVSSSSAKLTL